MINWVYRWGQPKSGLFCSPLIVLYVQNTFLGHAWPGPYSDWQFISRYTWPRQFVHIMIDSCNWILQLMLIQCDGWSWLQKLFTMLEVFVMIQLGIIMIYMARKNQSLRYHHFFCPKNDAFLYTKLSLTFKN